MSKKLTTEMFIERALKIHGDKYKYHYVKYMHSGIKVLITCLKHGNFLQRPDAHLCGQGCPKCGIINSTEKITYTTRSFIDRACVIHNNFYIYIKSLYINNRSKVIITCPKHGDFKQTPNSHLNGNGCSKCANEKQIKLQTKTTKEFIKDANVLHNFKYSYVKVKYKKAKEKVIITCQIHGDFEQTPDCHLRGSGCKKCGVLKSANTRIKTLDDFIYQSKIIHNDKYLYKKTKYKKVKEKVVITCPIHDDFEQTPDCHLSGRGCSRCSHHVSKPEYEISGFLKDNKIIIKQSDRTIIKPYELDIIVEDFKLAIEYCGLYWHSETIIKKSDKTVRSHLDKAYLAQDKGYHLMTIFEPEWLLKKDILKSMILAKCNIYDKKIGARKCLIKQIDSKQARKFFDENHIQGFSMGRHFGLFFKEELVSAMSFSKYKNDFNLTRFVNKKNTLVHGAFSKLLKYFIKNNIFNKIFTFADKRFFTGIVYKKNGFKLVHDVEPSYYYFKKHTDLLHKRNFQHQYLKKRFKNYDPALTEYQNCLNNGFDRIWDCGKIKYELSRSMNEQNS